MFVSLDGRLGFHLRLFDGSLLQLFLLFGLVTEEPRVVTCHVLNMGDVEDNGQEDHDPETSQVKVDGAHVEFSELVR